MTDLSPLEPRAAALVRTYEALGRKIVTAESCTGGLVAALLTAIPGSSAVVERGFVTYSNAAKSEAIGVPADLVRAHGAVSEPVARTMAEGALRHSHADVAVSITGIAGPGGGSAEKPVGLVWFGLAQAGRPTQTRECRFDDTGRTGIRLAAVTVALELLESAARRE